MVQAEIACSRASDGVDELTPTIAVSGIEGGGNDRRIEKAAYEVRHASYCSL